MQHLLAERLARDAALIPPVVDGPAQSGQGEEQAEEERYPVKNDIDDHDRRNIDEVRKDALAPVGVGTSRRYSSVRISHGWPFCVNAVFGNYTNPNRCS